MELCDKKYYQPEFGEFFFSSRLQQNKTAFVRTEWGYAYKINGFILPLPLLLCHFCVSLYFSHS